MNDTYWLFGGRLRVLAAAADTDGRYDLVEGRFAPGTRVPPHRHRRYSEQFYVVAGEFTVRAGGRTVVLGPGDSHVIPAGTPHGIVATSDGPARALVVTSPSGFARFVAEVGTPDDGTGTPPTAQPDMARVLRVAAELGDELIPTGPDAPEFVGTREQNKGDLT